MDVLILEKVPAREKNLPRAKLGQMGNFLLDVIDASKEVPGLARAVQHFSGEKVVTETLAAAAQA